MLSYILTAIDFNVTLRLADTVGYSVQSSAGLACMCKTFFCRANFALSHHYDYCLLFKPSLIQTSLCITA